MIVLKVRNVNEALPLGLELIRKQGVLVSPRGLNTLEVPCPVTTVYRKPLERVLLDPVRDANPFFHFMEAMWILGGRNDVEFPCIFNKNLAQYSDNGKTFFGAYGFRLRSNGIDQLAVAVNRLKADHDTRRVVLAMWDKTDLTATSNDIPCNDLIMVKIRNGKLNITVCNRSNDAIWGCYGANAVQFSYIQEYLAAMVGVEVGEYRQVSDSFHAYTDNPQWERLKDKEWDYSAYPYDHFPLVDDPKSFDGELTRFLLLAFQGKWYNRIFSEVAIPMYMSWVAHKKSKNGMVWAEQIADEAWRKACCEWLKRRHDGY